MADLVTAYASVFNKVDTILDSQGRRVFKIRQIYNDQPARIVAGKAYNVYEYPQVYVEMKMGQETNLGQRLNAFNINFVFHIVMVELAAPNGGLDQNLNIFGLRDMINRTFIGFFPSECGPLRYVTEYQSYNHGNIYEYNMVYEAHYMDTTAIQATFSATFSSATASLSSTLSFTGSWI